MISHIYIDGFKSFRDFRMYFSPFTVIAGSNASGKSNLFDALALLSNLADGMTIQAAFDSLRGEKEEMFTLFNDGSRSERMTFIVEMLVDRHITDEWGQQAEVKYTRLKYELILRRVDDLMGPNIVIEHEQLSIIPKNNDSWATALSVAGWDKWRPGGRGARRLPFISHIAPDAKLNISDEGLPRKSFSIPGSKRTFLSRFDIVEYPHLFAARREMINWHFLHLNPRDLREPSSTTNNGLLTPSGKNLAGALWTLKEADPYNLVVISRKFSKFLPNYTAVDVVRDEENKRLILTVEDSDGRKYTSRVLSEGTLRILALCVLAVDESFAGTLCFEEPENGIHPFRLAMMTELLGNFAYDFSNPEEPLRQVIVNSHSPLFLMLAKKLDDGFVMTYMSRLVTNISEENGHRVKVAATRMTPVHNGKLTGIAEISSNELKMAVMTENDFIHFMGLPNTEEQL